MVHENHDLDAADMSLLTYEEAAEAAGVPLSTLWQWVSRYKLTKIPAKGRGAAGARYLLLEREVLDCEAARRASPRGRPRTQTYTRNPNSGRTHP